MTVETALYPNQLNTSWPAQSDIVREGAGHIRAVKTVLKTTFPNVTGAVTPTHVELNYIVGVTSGVQAQINTKGDIAGQTWTGTHVFPSTTTVGPLTPTIQGYLATVTSDAQAQINTKAAKAGDTYTGAHNFGGATSVTLPAATSIGSVSDVEIGYLDGVTAPVQSQFAGKADINGESYTGTHDFTGATVQVATQPAGTSNTTPASTAFVAAAALSTALPGQAGNAGKFLTTDGTNASWGSAVSSVNGKTGVVALGANDVGALAVGQYGFGATALPQGVTDLNAAEARSMWFMGTAMANAPAGSAGKFLVQQLVHSSGYITQIAYGFDGLDGQIFMRQKSNGTWGGWRPMASSAEPPVSVTGGVIDLAKGSTFYAAVSGNTTFNIINFAPGHSFVLEVYLTAGVMSFPAAYWPDGIAPTGLQVNKRHLFFFQLPNNANSWLGSCLANYPQ